MRKIFDKAAELTPKLNHKIEPIMKISWLCISLLLFGCHQQSPVASMNGDNQNFVSDTEEPRAEVTWPLPEEAVISVEMQRQTTSAKTLKLNKYIGKYDYCDSQGRINLGTQKHLGVEILPDGTYGYDPGKNGSRGKYTIQKDGLLLHNFTIKRRTARAKLNGRFLTILDKSLGKGLRVIKVWPIQSVHYQIQPR